MLNEAYLWQQRFGAIDQEFHSKGHLILCVRHNNRDFVKILDVPAEWAMEDYLQCMKFLSERYGIKTTHFDGLNGVSIMDLMETGETR